MSKGLNNAAAKSVLAKELEESAKKVETQRFYNTEEGKAILAERARKLANDMRRAEFAANQLVWKDVLLEDDENGTLATQCNKIISIGEDFVNVEMMYVTIDGKKEDRFKDVFGTSHFKGEVSTFTFYHLEKHVAKTTGNVWWKVK